MFSEENESCDTACQMNKGYPCYVESMRAMNDIYKFEHVGDKLLGDTYYLCNTRDVSSAGNSPGFASSSFVCNWSDGSSSCDAKMVGYGRICCCGDSNNMCPLED